VQSDNPELHLEGHLGIHPRPEGASALPTLPAAIKNGNGPEQLKTVLQSPNLLCVLGASTWQNNQQVTDACNQAATALTPVLQPLVGALDPVLGNL
jgi:hypothetical protein